MIDEYSKVVVAASRRELMKKVVSHDWKWYDVVSGKWCTYTKPNNDIIDKAFWDGETSVKITAGRRRYVIQFTAMVQINEETSNRRPVMICLKNKKSEDLEAKAPGDMVNFESMEVDEMPTNADEKLSPLNIEQGLIIVRSCVGLMVPSIDGDTLHAVLRLCLRLTREYEHSFLFVDLGGMKKLLNLTQISTFHSFVSLITLLIRHLFEDQPSLRYAMEKTLRLSVSINAVATREINFFLRVQRYFLRLKKKIF
jgi:E3 ubiquitin-protein ligase HUWE1